MSLPNNYSVFIPHQIVNETTFAYLLGYYKTLPYNVIVNCTFAIKAEENDQTAFNTIFEILESYSDFDDCERLSFLGLIYSSETTKAIKLDPLVQNDNNYFILHVDKNLFTFHFDRLYPNYSHENISSQIIMYDPCDLMKSNLLLDCRIQPYALNSDGGFMSFLINSNKKNVSFCELHTLSVEEPRLSDSAQFILFSSNIMTKLDQFLSFLATWWPQLLSNVILLSCIGNQFHQRLLHYKRISSDFKTKDRLSLRWKNLVSAILFDVICGLIITFMLLHSDVPEILLNICIEKTNEVVNGLKVLITWLMGVPAGLKLNIPLNGALGQFFLYHIYLWETYIMIVQPAFALVLKMSTVIGVLGVSFILSLFNDLISLATIHIYCFYGYAAKLYAYQMLSLCSLWRLFRGKKWNPLRKRVDFYTYDVHQLYLGTLIFTVLLFLLPTVMVYYIVFTCLRIILLILQGLMSRIINVITVFPLYSIILRMFQSSEMAGNVSFAIFSMKSAVVLTMQTVQVPFITVIKATLPELKKHAKDLTWRDFLSSLIWGKIVYPL